MMLDKLELLLALRRLALEQLPNGPEAIGSVCDSDFTGVFE